jgi:hypothetical protein
MQKSSVKFLFIFSIFYIFYVLVDHVGSNEESPSFSDNTIKQLAYEQVNEKPRNVALPVARCKLNLSDDIILVKDESSRSNFTF